MHNLNEDTKNASCPSFIFVFLLYILALKFLNIIYLCEYILHICISILKYEMLLCEPHVELQQSVSDTNILSKLFLLRNKNNKLLLLEMKK